MSQYYRGTVVSVRSELALEVTIFALLGVLPIFKNRSYALINASDCLCRGLTEPIDGLFYIV